MADEGVGAFDVEPGASFTPKDQERRDAPTRSVLGEPPSESTDELPPPPAEPFALELVDEETIRSGLTAAGSLTHTLVAIDPDGTEWLFLQHELDAIAPPLTRIVNRYPALAAVAGRYGDPFIALFGLGGYTKRSLDERAAARARRRLEAEAEETGQAGFTFAAKPDEG